MLIFGTLFACGLAGCTIEGLLHATASLGGDVANQRGNVQLLIINNTPYRAIFSLGGYDEFDRDTEPVLMQFASDPAGLVLEGNAQTPLGQFECHRVFSIGGDGLIARVRANLEEEEYDDELLVGGVYFSSADMNSEEADQPTEGVAAPHDAYIGVDFSCGSLLIYRFEYNDVGPEEFVIDLTVIPSESTR